MFGLFWCVMGEDAFANFFKQSHNFLCSSFDPWPSFEAHMIRFDVNKVVNNISCRALLHDHTKNFGKVGLVFVTRPITSTYPNRVPNVEEYFVDAAI